MPKDVTRQFIFVAIGALVVLLASTNSVFNKEWLLQFKDGKEESASKVSLWFGITSMFHFVGSIIGALLIPPVANRIGRNVGIFCSNLILQLGLVVAVISVQLSSFIGMTVAKFLLGLSTGLNFGLIPMYLLEIAPGRIRGAAGISFFLALTLSDDIIQIPLIGTTWWYMNYICAFVPGLLQLAILSRCPESPKFNLLIKGKETLGERALVTLRGTSDVHSELEQIMSEDTSRPTLCAFLRNESFRTSLLISCVAMFAQTICGHFPFTNSLVTRYTLSESTAVFLYYGLPVVRIVVVVGSLFAVDKLGRRALLLTGFIGMLIAMLFIYLCTFDSAEWIGYLVIVLYFLSVALYCLGPASIPWFLASELFSTSCRPLAMSVVVLVKFVTAFLVGLLSTLAAGTLGSSYDNNVILLWAIPTALAIFYLWFKLPETKEKGYEQNIGASS